MIYTLLNENAASHAFTSYSRENTRVSVINPKKNRLFLLQDQPFQLQCLKTGFSSFLASGTTRCNHRWQKHSQRGGSLINSKVSAIRPTLPSQRARPHSKRRSGNKKKKQPSCILYISSKQSDKGFSPPTKYIIKHTNTGLGAFAIS